jgi:UDP-N-acetylglucosamine 4,6-dehydratase
MKAQTVFVTGGSGTFGSAFIRYALDSGANRVISFARRDHSQIELKRQIDDPRLEIFMGDVRDADRLRYALGVSPDIVVHAAATKRIETCEADPSEAMKINIDGTRVVVEAAIQARVPKVLFISSDKACSPDTPYGITKAAAEWLALGLNARVGKHDPTRISAVRYGNVLGSQGSFLEQILRVREGGALTITDPAASRFWWTVEDAVRFVGDVLGRMRGAEVWIPRLVSATVGDLVAAIAPRADISVVGMRGAEKLHEAMVSPTESRRCWQVPSGYLLLPYHGQSWSPRPPADAVPVPEGFTYTSADDLLPVRFEELPCA